MTFRFSEKYGVLVDEQEILIPTGEVKWLRRMIAKHLEHPQPELEAIGRRTVEENHPDMVYQFNFDHFKEP